MILALLLLERHEMRESLEELAIPQLLDHVLVHGWQLFQIAIERLLRQGRVHHDQRSAIRERERFALQGE
jgi:hypothetical protein